MKLKKANAAIGLLSALFIIVHIGYNAFSFLTLYYNPTLQMAVSLPFVVLVCVHAVLGMLTLFLSFAKCLKCGLCLEVCPNYTSGANFFGALFANDCYLVAARNKAKTDEIKALYDERFGRDCSKALSCMDVCPAGISTIASMARLNRG